MVDEVHSLLAEVGGALLAAVHDVLVGLRAGLALEGRLAAEALKGQDAHGPDVHRMRVGQQRLVLVLLRPTLLRADQDLRRVPVRLSQLCVCADVGAGVHKLSGRAVHVCICSCAAAVLATHLLDGSAAAHAVASSCRARLGRHVVQRASPGDRTLECAIDGQAKVSKLYLLVLGQEDVLGLDVPVNDALQQATSGSERNVASMPQAECCPAYLLMAVA